MGYLLLEMRLGLKPKVQEGEINHVWTVLNKKMLQREWLENPQRVVVPNFKAQPAKFFSI